MYVSDGNHVVSVLAYYVKLVMLVRFLVCLLPTLG